MSDKEDILKSGKRLEELVKEMPESLMYGSPEMDFREIPQSQGLMYGPPEWYYGDSPEKQADETTDRQKPDKNRLKLLSELLNKDKKQNKDTDND